MIAFFYIQGFVEMLGIPIRQYPNNPMLQYSMCSQRQLNKTLSITIDCARVALSHS
jgi:hypothetical protein